MRSSLTRFGWLSFIAVVIASSPAGHAGRAQTPGPVQFSGLILGVVRGDGILLPLASRENEAWTILRYLVTDGDKSLFKLLEAPRVPREGWTYVPWNAGSPRPLAIKDSVTTDAHCGRQEGFATNASTSGAKLEAPHLMAGIAVHGNVSTVRVENMVHQPDDSSRRVARFIVQLTHALEAERTSVPSNSPQSAIPLNERGRVPVQITTLARDRVFDVDYYYFEARKRYGTVEAYANGWLASSRFSVSIVRADGGIYRGGETARRWGRVLGVLRIGRTSVWVMEMRAYESDSYDIIEMPHTGLLSIAGGGC